MTGDLSCIVTYEFESDSELPMIGTKCSSWIRATTFKPVSSSILGRFQLDGIRDCGRTQGYRDTGKIPVK
jgi:hypothetical protein